MVKREEVEYETVERTVEVTVCDRCERSVENEAASTVALNPHVRENLDFYAEEVLDYCPECAKSLFDTEPRPLGIDVKSTMNIAGEHNEVNMELNRGHSWVLALAFSFCVGLFLAAGAGAITMKAMGLGMIGTIVVSLVAWEDLKYYSSS